MTTSENTKYIIYTQYKPLIDIFFIFLFFLSLSIAFMFFNKLLTEPWDNFLLPELPIFENNIYFYPQRNPKVKDATKKNNNKIFKSEIYHAKKYVFE